MKKILVFLGAILIFTGFSKIANTATYEGHFYEIVAYPGKTWQEATLHMENLLGPQYYFATITSQEEQEFIQSITTDSGEYWLGGYQNPADENSPAKNWYWVNNEGLFWDDGPVGAYANWSPGEPNDYYGGGSEQYLATWGQRQWRWNDEDNHPAYISGYIAEAPVPIPPAILLLSSGLIGLIGLRNKFKRG